MTAVDTNILVRILTNDDPNQARRAAQMLGRDKVFIPKTVILETEWVLRHAYGIERRFILKGFRRLFGLRNTHIEDPRIVFRAVAWYENGLDFADALHLASSAKATRFATFDKALAETASKLTPFEVFSPL